jgi:regulator of sigma E protease
MSELTFSVLSFLVALGVLITVHEFGHFWVARMLGVKVLRFSIGFGRPLLTWRHGSDRTEYVLAALPLGGYVKMLDETEAEVAPQEAHRAFNRQRLATRSAIVCAGPGFNFLFAVFAYWLMFVVGVTGAKPLIGDVEPGSTARAAGLRAGDEILAVAGEPTPTWDATLLAILPKVLDRGRVSLQVRTKEQEERRVTLDFSRAPLALERGNLLHEIGIRPFRPDIPAVIGKVVAGSAAERAGLRAGDKVLSADGAPIHDWENWVQYVRNHPEKPVRVQVQRGAATLNLEVRPERLATGRGPGIGHIGASVQVSSLAAGTQVGVMRYPPGQALVAGLKKTWDMTTLTIQLLAKMVVGQASWQNISGPISIAQYAGQAASVGLAAFLAFLAVISVSLGVLNLLPIPVLDGGHLLYYFIEVAKGSPLSDQAQMIGQRIGIALLLALMSVAFYNDLARLFS